MVPVYYPEGNHTFHFFSDCASLTFKKESLVLKQNGNHSCQCMIFTEGVELFEQQLMVDSIICQCRADRCCSSYFMCFKTILYAGLVLRFEQYRSCQVYCLPVLGFEEFQCWGLDQRDLLLIYLVTADPQGLTQDLNPNMYQIFI